MPAATYGGMPMWTLSTFYKSKEWESFRENLIDERTNPDDGLLYCEHCGLPIIKAYDIIGHHVLELTETNVNDWNISLNPNNVILIHHKCHNLLHKRFGFNKAVVRRVYLVYGPPLAGKSSFVRNAANETDLILDVDKIWQMVSNNPPYVKPDALKACVFGIRDTMLDMIRTRRGKWSNAYVIGGYPLPREREELASSLGAELIPIIEPMELCLDRLAECYDGRDRQQWERFIREWFDRAG